MKRYHFTIGFLSLIISLSMLLSFAVPVYAETVTPQDEESVDVSVWAGTNSPQIVEGLGYGLHQWASVNNSGVSGVITSISFEVVTTYINLSEVLVAERDQYNTATDLGSITLLNDWNTLSDAKQFEWNGELRPGETLTLLPRGIVSGSAGDSASLSWNILSSKLEGDVDNIDEITENDVSTINFEVIATGDLAIETRLVTTGDIEVGDNVTYEIYVKNIISPGVLESNPGLYYVLPEGSSFVSIVDLDENDGITASGCMPLPVQYLPPDFAYTGIVMQCGLQAASGVIPGNSSFPFALTMTASEGFSNGTAEVLGVVLANSGMELDSLAFIQSITTGGNAFDLDVNNIMRLSYDPDELVVTINRCDGIGEVVASDDACFTIEFNKDIYEPSFTVDDILLSPSGNVYSFVKDSNRKWTIRVNGLAAGQTLVVNVEPESVQDYSAVLNGTQVLGVNTVRYELNNNQGSNTNNSGNSANQTTANGTLARTGTTTSGYVSYAIALMLIGLVLTVASKTRASRSKRILRNEI